MTSVLRRDRRGDKSHGEEEAHRQRLEAKGCQQPPKAGRSKEGFSPEPSEGVQPCQHLDFVLLAFTTV